MRIKLIFLSVTIVSSFLLSFAFASPTSNEFIPCKKIAVSVLEYCLNENSYSANDFCWTKSKEHYASCAKKVFQGHVPKEREAKMKAEIKARAEIERNK
jgi:hypothetical protein